MEIKELHNLGKDIGRACTVLTELLERAKTSGMEVRLKVSRKHSITSDIIHAVEVEEIKTDVSWTPTENFDGSW